MISNISIGHRVMAMATNEIAKNIDQASNGTVQVSEDIENVASVAEVNGTSARELLDASSDMEGQAQNLQQAVRDLASQIRAA